MFTQLCDKTMISSSFFSFTAQLLLHNIAQKNPGKKLNFFEQIFAVDPISIIFAEFNFEIWGQINENIQNKRRPFKLFSYETCCLSASL